MSGTETVRRGGRGAHQRPKILNSPELVLITGCSD
jgi:hypothetical protein